MQIFFEQKENADFYFCYSLNSKNSVRLPENISLRNFFLLLQGSLDAIRPVVIVKNEAALSEMNFNLLRSTHYTLDAENFLFLNFSIRNSLVTDSEIALISFEDIRQNLQKILKKS